MIRFPGFLLSLIFFCLAAGSCFAQLTVVTKPVNLRPDPSTANPPIRLLLPPERVRRIPPREQGDFFRVRTDVDETGWVWKENVAVYDRDDWMKRWDDADGDCQDTRQEVLIAESTVAVTFDPDECRGRGADRHCDCRVQSGRWVGPYSGETFADPGDLDIDHMVPLANAHVSGGWAWDSERKEAYANDLGNPEHLIAVKNSLNRQKGDRGPEEWKPPRREHWCEYAADWLAIKDRWGMTLTAGEAAAVAEMRGGCR